jgi:glutaryl-CoA dehydrogenase
MMLGTALVTDHFLVREQFDDAEWDAFMRTRRFVDEEVLPVINDYWERAEFPRPLARRLAELELLGDALSPLALGLVHMELNRGDGSLGTFCGVQTGLAMKTAARTA